ncbi:MAG: glycosyltransferase [Gammaproteobacteria bacterium]|nr:glycosyltransferase [Gammaproteobacteria bacterium]
MRILILTSSTGGGHDMRARALEAWVKLKKPDWTVRIHHALEDTHGLYRFGVGLYNFIQKTWPPLHHIYYNFLEIVGVLSNQSSILGQARFTAVLEDFRPTLIFSVHDSTNHGFFQLAKQVLGADKVRCVTYCTEMHGGYGMSRHWVNPTADLFIASLPETVEAAIKLGMPQNRIQLGGFLLHPTFYDAPSDATVKQFWKEHLQLDPSQFTLILSTGANGANHHRPILKALRTFDLPLQIVALCGQSQKTHQKVLELAKQYQSTTLTIRALPTTNKMAILMQGASAILTRPGAGTTNEAIQMRCPLIINKLTGLMPQEMINERFAVKHQICETLSYARDLPAILHTWIAQPEEHSKLTHQIHKITPKQHPTNILSILESLVL